MPTPANQKPTPEEMAAAEAHASPFDDQANRDVVAKHSFLAGIRWARANTAPETNEELISGNEKREE